MGSNIIFPMILRLLGRLSSGEEGKGTENFVEKNIYKNRGREEYQVVGNFIHPCLQVLYNYININNKTSNKQHLEQLKEQAGQMKALRQMLLLFIRSYNQETQSYQYLADLVVCNSLVLNNMESSTTELRNHMTQFANKELMEQYGHLLLDHTQNSVQAGVIFGPSWRGRRVFSNIEGKIGEKKREKGGSIMGGGSTFI